MAVYDLEEQEQLDELKTWWQQYGNLVTSGIVVLALIAVAWQGWNWWQRSQSGQASTVFAAMQQAASQKDAKRARELAGELIDRLGLGGGERLPDFGRERGLCGQRDDVGADGDPLLGENFAGAGVLPGHLDDQVPLQFAGVIVACFAQDRLFARDEPAFELGVRVLFRRQSKGGPQLDLLLHRFGELKFQAPAMDTGGENGDVDGSHLGTEGGADRVAAAGKWQHGQAAEPGHAESAECPT